MAGINIELNWSTTNEQNNTGFQIERINMTDINNIWSSIGFVNGKNNNIINNYIFLERYKVNIVTRLNVFSKIVLGSFLILEKIKLSVTDI